MILGDASHPSAQASAENRATLCELFARALAKHPERIALADPPNRESFTEGPARQFTYAEADAAIDAIAGRLRRLSLHTDAVVAFQLAHTAESVLTLLGILRAGMIAAPLPMLWRHADMAAALKACGAKALIAAARLGDADGCAIAMRAAADSFPVKYVCAFGRHLPDGVIPLDDVLDAEDDEEAPGTVERSGNPAAHAAIVTFDVTTEGIVPVARNHLELIAGGLSLYLETKREAEAATLTATPFSSFAGVALALVPWLLDAGTLVLHQPFDPDVFDIQRAEHRCDTLIVPGSLTARMREARLLEDGDGLKTIVTLWREPARLPETMPPHGKTAMFDMLAFGEIALLASRRNAKGKPPTIALGPVGAPRGSPSAVLLAEIARGDNGMLAFRGPMVPRAPFPPNAERGDAPHLKIAQDCFIDTAYACHVQRDGVTVALTSAPSALIAIGGYRFAQRELDELSGASGFTIAALPDAMTGHRIAVDAPDEAALRMKLDELGANALIAARRNAA